MSVVELPGLFFLDTRYDTLVVMAAVEAGCQTLLSEDLQHNRVVQGVTILNPFSASVATPAEE